MSVYKCNFLFLFNTAIMARSNLKEYDCLLIYNHEDSSFSDGGTREDRSLLFSFVDFVDRELKCEYRIHHHDRDSIPGRSVFYELERVIESSQVILLILDKGFLKNSWKCFSKEAAIKNLIDASTDPKCTTSNRLIPIFIRLEKNEIPSALKTLTPIEIMGESDITEKWKNLKIAIDWHFRQERIQRSIVAKSPNYSQLTPEPKHASAVSKEPRSNSISNGPSSRPAILPNQNTVNTPDLLSTVPHRQIEDLVTISGHGSFSGEQPHEPVVRSIRTRVSETNQPITHTSSVQGDTSIDGSSSMSHSCTDNEDITIPKETAVTVTPGTLRLQSTDVEPDALQSMTPTTAATVQQSVASPQNHFSTPSLSQSTPDSGIGLMSPELGSLNVASFSHEDKAPESLYPSSQIANSVTLQDDPDTAVNQSPDGPIAEDGERPSFFFRAVHFLLHAIFQPDKVYAPP